MLQPGRQYSATSSYRYGFNGKENDNEVKGEGNQQDYGMRIYDPRLGRFLSVDPLLSKYPELTPYQFASNTPIWAIDLDGLEASAINADQKAKKYGYNSLKIQMVDAGHGDVQTQLYSLKAHGNAEEFSKLKEIMMNTPQEITDNVFAKYRPVQKANPNRLSEGDEVGILPKIGPIPIVPTWVYVRVMQVDETENSFKMTFATLEGHPEAGYVSFSGSFNEKTGEITFNVLTETREVWFINRLGPSRGMQQSQWQIVIENAREALGKERKDVTETQRLQTYKYDETKSMGKGEKMGDIIETINK